MRLHGKFASCASQNAFTQAALMQIFAPCVPRARLRSLASANVVHFFTSKKKLLLINEHLNGAGQLFAAPAKSLCFYGSDAIEMRTQNMHERIACKNFHTRRKLLCRINVRIIHLYSECPKYFSSILGGVSNGTMMVSIVLFVFFYIK